MASDEDEDIDDIDEELARIERQIQELEQEAGEAPQPEAPDPEPEDVEAPAPEEAFEGEPDVEEEQGRLARAIGRFRRDDGDEEASEASDEGDGSRAFGLLGREDEDQAGEDVPEEEEDGTEAPEDVDPTEAEDDPQHPTESSDLLEASEQDTAVEEEPEAVESEADRAPEQEPGPEEEAEPSDEALTEEPGTETEEREAEDAEEASEDEAGFLGAIAQRFGSQSEEDEPAPSSAEEPEEQPASASAREQGASDPQPDPDPAGEDAQAVEGDPGGGDEPEAEDDPEAEAAASGASASALLARFQGGGSEDPGDEPPTDEAADDEEDDDGGRGGILIVALVVLLLLAGLAAAAYYLVPQGSTGEDASADLVADTFTDDEGNYVVMIGQPVTLDASGSQGDVEGFQWAFGDGDTETTSEATVQHTYAERGSYEAQVTLQGAGDASQTIDVVVVDPPTAQPEIMLGGEPVAEPGTIGNNAFLGDQVTLDASASSADPDHQITAYEWDTNGDGEPEATGSQAEVGFDEAGAWTIALTVRDDLGNEDTATRTVHVSDERVIEDTVGPSDVEPATQSYDVDVDRGRQDVPPVRFHVELTYNASSEDGGTLPVQPELDANLDLNATDPEGNVYEAEDDEGEGSEELVLEGGDLSALGEWNVTVQQDNQNLGATSEVAYELTIQVLH